MVNAASSSEKTPLWRDERVLRMTAQVISAVIILGFFFWAVVNFLAITTQRGMPLTFEFLKEPAGFPISESFILMTRPCRLAGLSWQA